MLLLNCKRNKNKTDDYLINQAYYKKMLFTTKNRILIKHFRLDKKMAKGKYA